MWGILRKAWRTYEGQAPSHRLHVLARVLTCPFSPLLARVPASGPVLDVGCGHGVLINLLARDPSRQGQEFHGIDHDAGKIAVARSTALKGTSFSTSPLASFAPASFAAITIVDVLYAVRLEEWPSILEGCFRALRPGGLLLVKEVVNEPRWKYWAIMAQESLSVRVFRITKGARPHIESPGVYRDAIIRAGFTVQENRPLPSPAFWVSHYLWVAAKPKLESSIPASLIKARTAGLVSASSSSS